MGDGDGRSDNVRTFVFCFVFCTRLPEALLKMLLIVHDVGSFFFCFLLQELTNNNGKHVSLAECFLVSGQSAACFQGKIKQEF